MSQRVNDRTEEGMMFKIGSIITCLSGNTYAIVGKGREKDNFKVIYIKIIDEISKSKDTDNFKIDTGYMELTGTLNPKIAAVLYGEIN